MLSRRSANNDSSMRGTAAHFPASALLGNVWQESGILYGYRTLHDNLPKHEVTRFPNHIPASGGIKAQIGPQASPRLLWRQTVGCGGQYSCPAVRCRCAEQGMDDRYQLNPDPCVFSSGHGIDLFSRAASSAGRCAAGEPLMSR